jgi:hypothetical protein
MSLKTILKDNELELMQTKKTASGKVVYAICTTYHSAYTLDYMLITVDDSTMLESADIMYAYFTDSTDLFYYFDLTV